MSSSSCYEEWCWVLRRCCSFKQLQQAHGVMVTRGLLDHQQQRQDKTAIISRFMEASSCIGFSNYAYSVFESTTTTRYLHNTVIKALSSSSSPELAVFVYNHIRVAGLRPDTYSVPFVLRAVARLNAIMIGRQVHCHSVRSGLDIDVNVVTALIQMYCSCGRVSDARRLFDESYNKRRKRNNNNNNNVALWNAMVAGYVKLGDIDNACQLFEKMPQTNVVSWTTLISGYAQMNRPNEAILLFRRMQLHNVEPDEVTMLVTLSACSQLGALHLGEWIHDYLINKHGCRNLISLNNALIDMYAKSGNISKALQVFHDTKYKTVVTWTTVIAGLALHGLGTQALDMFAQMERDGITPNRITFIAILSACSHARLVDTGLCYFDIMVSRYGIQPKIEHYGCMVDLLGRAGYLREAHQLVSQMPFQANAAVWGSLLAASNIHGNDELGELALQHLIVLEPHNSGNYLLLSNIYSAMGRWNESRILRKMMRENGVKKMPGGSSIEVNSRVHGFIAGDESHSKGDMIYQVVYTLFMQCKLAGHLQQDYEDLLEFDE